MSIRRKIINRSVRLLNFICSKNMKYKPSISITDTQSTITKYGVLSFFCPNELTRWRSNTFHEKEPETLEWIDTFSDGDILWDIGANVGLYSLYAAQKGVNVIAFEPSNSNYFILNKNIEINNLDNKIQALAIAFSDKSKIDSFYMEDTSFGTATHSFGEQVNCEGKLINESFKQAMCGYSIDDFIKTFQTQVPTHIKIDVDGIEEKIIKGSIETLNKEKLKSIMVEIDNESDAKKIIPLIESNGLKYIGKKHAPMFDNTKYSQIYNYFFKR